MEDFAAIHASKSERTSPNSRFEPAQTMSDDEKSLLEKGHQNHTLATPFRGSDEENQTEESHFIAKTGGAHTVPYKWDTLLDPFINAESGAKKFPNIEIVLSEQVENSRKDGPTSPLEERRSILVNNSTTSSRSAKLTGRSRKGQRHSQSSTRSVLSKATRDLIFTDSTDSSDFDIDDPLMRVDSIKEVLSSNVAVSRESSDDHDERKPIKSFKIKKSQSKQGSRSVASLTPTKSHISVTSSNGRSKSKEADDQEKVSPEMSKEKNVLARQHPFTLTNLFANSCLPSQPTQYEQETKDDILITKPTNHLSRLTEVFQCGNQYDEDDIVSPRNTQLVLDVFDKTLCGIPAKMANISLDDFLHDEYEDDLDMHRSKSRQTRSRSTKASPTTPSSTSRVDTSSHLYGVLKEHMGNAGARSGDSNSHTMGNSIDNDPQVQRELQRLCKLLKAKLDGQASEPASYESDSDDYDEDESESDYDDEEDKLFESWVRTGPIMDLFGIGCNAKNSARREITYDDRVASGRSYYRNERFYPEEEDGYSDGYDEDYYSDAESTESNLTIVAPHEYK